MVKLVFDIEPQSQLRPRAAYNTRSHHIVVYDPKVTHEYKQRLRQLAQNQYTQEPLDSALKVDVSFFRPVQKSLSAIERARRISGEHRPAVKSDIDNYIKALFDSLNGVVWQDDKQICDLVAHKYYSDKPRIEIEVTTVNEEVTI
ncbi:RusA family crossover junction endodeoxyribonuclease [Limosilactobacillus reuteri]|uniref:RusA family crossover junction endodeoxyribonuclease n=1 Tax=Limosilactobacillus reuteri TaxID=1598 RepID=UPI001E537D83|nr:RusA family crossover junction endodeoxyribonuclease [Limosilactobacillus reuteri]MCC4501338.1 RusA family crossover junction endodeoxyribonuclease [Limosilactobacillus reuteri]